MEKRASRSSGSHQPPQSGRQSGRRQPARQQSGQQSGQRRSGRRKRSPLRTAARLLLAAAALALFFRWSNTSLQTTRWEVALPGLPDGFDGCRVTVLSDLHGAVFGRDNGKLFRATAKTKPEYIFLLGDLEDAYRGGVSGYVEQLADGLTAIAPVFYVTGNHEWAIGSVRELKARLTEHGVTVLSNDYELTDRNGDTLVLAGIDDPNGPADQRSPASLAEEIYRTYGDPCWFLLAHRNDRFPGEYSQLGADLVLSGHGHGGLIRLPFTDGLVSTYGTLFPSWTAGLYEKDGSRLFVTRGLGNSGRTFRLFNRPEIAALTLRKG